MITHSILEDLAMVLCIAAVTTVLFQALRQPVVVGYLIAGMIVGPNVRIPLFADVGRIHTLSELGVILLIFSIGIEFSVRRLAKVATTAGFIAVLEVSLMLWLGYLTGKAFGWTELESLYTGAVIAISSTTIVAKAFAEQNVDSKLSEIVFGVLLFEDLIAILLLAVLTALSSGAGLSALGLAATAGRLAGFLVILAAIGMLIVPRGLAAVDRLGSRETLLVASIGICFASAFAAEQFGYSVALGAFLAGSFVAESPVASKVGHLIEPVRDMFGAVFFVSVGMLIDPALIAQHWAAVAVLTAVVIVGKLTGVTLGAFLIGDGVATSVRAGMSLAQIGEFSFIIAGLGLSMKATGELLYTLAVAVSAITTFLTPFMIRTSAAAGEAVDRRMPRPLQVFAALYSGWIQRIREARGDTLWGELRKPILMVIANLIAVAIVVITFSVEELRIYDWFDAHTNLPDFALDGLMAATVLAVSTPFYAGLALGARRIGRALAKRAIPHPAEGDADFGALARRILSATLQLIVILLIGGPLLAITQPFFPAYDGAGFVGVMVGLLAIVLWRTTGRLDNQVRAGALAVAHEMEERRLPDRRFDADGATHLVDGIGNVFQLELHPACRAIGKTLAELNLRGATGAAVLAITRGTSEVMIPTGHEVLEPGDLLAMAGTTESIDAARELLLAGRE
jgi:CPA2 family monovalent cation:H+ antiporter-2